MTSIWVCSECGSDNVEVQGWRNLKTNHFDENGCDTGDQWCNQCEEHHHLELKEEIPEEIMASICGEMDRIDREGN